MCAITGALRSYVVLSLTLLEQMKDKSVMTGYRVALLLKDGVESDDTVLPHFYANCVHSDPVNFRNFLLSLCKY